MTIYIDDDYKCYVSAADGRRAIETDFFDGKCKVFIEGYRFIPAGEKWIMPNGVFFRGEMVAPWKDYDYLQVVQAAYEEGQDEILTTVESALGVGM
jgi:hypothetical protein